MSDSEYTPKIESVTSVKGSGYTENEEPIFSPEHRNEKFDFETGQVISGVQNGYDRYAKFIAIGGKGGSGKSVISWYYLKHLAEKYPEARIAYLAFDDQDDTKTLLGLPDKVESNGLFKSVNRVTISEYNKLKQTEKNNGRSRLHPSNLENTVRHRYSPNLDLYLGSTGIINNWETPKVMEKLGSFFELVGEAYDIVFLDTKGGADNMSKYLSNVITDSTILLAPKGNAISDLMTCLHSGIKENLARTIEKSFSEFSENEGIKKISKTYGQSVHQTLMQLSIIASIGIDPDKIKEVDYGQDLFNLFTSEDSSHITYTPMNKKYVKAGIIDPIFKDFDKHYINSKMNLEEMIVAWKRIGVTNKVIFDGLASQVTEIENAEIENNKDRESQRYINLKDFEEKYEKKRREINDYVKETYLSDSPVDLHKFSPEETLPKYHKLVEDKEDKYLKKSLDALQDIDDMKIEYEKALENVEGSNFREILAKRIDIGFPLENIKNLIDSSPEVYSKLRQYFINDNSLGGKNYINYFLCGNKHILPSAFKTARKRFTFEDFKKNYNQTKESLSAVIKTCLESLKDFSDIDNDKWFNRLFDKNYLALSRNKNQDSFWINQLGNFYIRDHYVNLNLQKHSREEDNKIASKSTLKMFKAYKTKLGTLNEDVFNEVITEIFETLESVYLTEVWAEEIKTIMKDPIVRVSNLNIYSLGVIPHNNDLIFGEGEKMDFNLKYKIMEWKWEEFDAFLLKGKTKKLLRSGGMNRCEEYKDGQLENKQMTKSRNNVRNMINYLGNTASSILGKIRLAK